MQKSKRTALLITPLLFALAFCFAFIAKQANAHGEEEQEINQGQSLGQNKGNGTSGEEDAVDNDDNATSGGNNVIGKNRNVDGDDGDSSSSAGKTRSEEHQSVVADFVHSLLDVADGEKGGIGEQIRVVAREQNESASATARAIERVEKRSWVRTFFFGTDYKNLGALRSEIVKTRNRINQLDRLIETIQQEEDRTELEGQMRSLEQEQIKLENFVNENENRFSLFGWFVKMFNR